MSLCRIHITAWGEAKSTCQHLSNAVSPGLSGLQGLGILSPRRENEYPTCRGKAKLGQYHWVFEESQECSDTAFLKSTVASVYLWEGPTQATAHSC